jgi:saccharopine dehydrogenase-like NADP-dependent oxidoreductase
MILVGPAERDLARLVGVLDPRRVTAAAVPATVEGIASALAGADVAVAALSNPAEELTAVGAAISANVPYVSSCEDPETIRAVLTAGFGAVKATTVIGASWTPGVTNLLVRAAADHLDEVRSVRVAWATSRRDEGADGLGRLMLAWSGDAELIEGGRLGTAPAGTAGEQVFFPPPAGWQQVMLARAAEVLSLPAMLPGLDSLVVKGGLAGLSGAPPALALSMVARLSMMGRGAGDARPGRLTRSALAALAPRGRRAVGWSSLRVDVSGRRDGQARELTYGMVDHLANLETAPLVVAALMVGRGETMIGGVAPPEAALDHERFLSLLADRGVKAAHLER